MRELPISSCSTVVSPTVSYGLKSVFSTHGRRIDLLAVDDDVDVRHDRLAEEVHVRRQATAHRRGLAAGEQRLRVASAASCERKRGDQADEAPHALPRVNMR